MQGLLDIVDGLGGFNPITRTPGRNAPHDEGAGALSGSRSGFGRDFSGQMSNTAPKPKKKPSTDPIQDEIDKIYDQLDAALKQGPAVNPDKPYEPGKPANEKPQKHVKSDMELAIEWTYRQVTGHQKSAADITKEAQERAKEEEEKKKEAPPPPPPPPPPASGKNNPNPYDPSGGGPVGPWVREATPNPEDPDGGGPVGPWLRPGSGLRSAAFMPNPEDPGGGGGPLGPWAQQPTDSRFGRLAKPNPDDPGGGVGPWARLLRRAR